ncbi:ABC transporter ATP-binding protein [Rubritalea tangerina]|uniref:ABC transporter ATP-binding protein n=1 Tax=Rubritalea tangerina TaxID=430798 RepID=A0ABW4Z956_9BACT
MSDVVVCCRSVVVRKRNKLLLNEVDFDLRAGAHTAIIGPNGAGKTTLLRVILGTQEIQGGTVEVGGVGINDYSRKELAKKMAYVPQLLAAEVAYSVEEFIGMGRYAHGGSAADPEVAEAMALMQVDAFAKRRVSSLSGGERQRVCIAAGLAQRAGILLLDEPLAHLDPAQRLDVQSAIAGLPEWVTVVVVTHDLVWAQQRFQRVLALDSGAVFADEKSSDFFSEGGVEGLFGGAVVEHLNGGGNEA